MGFPRQEYWSGWPFPSPGDLPDPGVEHRSAALQADSIPPEPQGSLVSTFCCHITGFTEKEDFKIQSLIP